MNQDEYPTAANPYYGGVIEIAGDFIAIDVEGHQVDGIMHPVRVTLGREDGSAQEIDINSAYPNYDGESGLNTTLCTCPAPPGYGSHAHDCGVYE